MNLTYLRLYDLKLFITHQHAETHPLSQYIALRSLLLGWGERNTKVEDTVQFNRLIRPELEPAVNSLPQAGIELCRKDLAQGLSSGSAHFSGFAIAGSSAALPFRKPSRKPRPCPAGRTKTTCLQSLLGAPSPSWDSLCPLPQASKYTFPCLIPPDPEGAFLTGHLLHGSFFHHGLPRAGGPAPAHHASGTPVSQAFLSVELAFCDALELQIPMK
ncbi:Cytochrome C Oxidase Assembly Protein Cox18 [Manis pentadactyla]|nr:Cytochrome C Oxidase Assembly Protein Cox18 [Manis pentadactyla]